MPKFSIKDLMIATTLIAVGLGIAITLEEPGGQHFITMRLAYCFGCSMVGTGIVYPIKRWEWSLLGFILGALFGMLLLPARMAL